MAETARAPRLRAWDRVGAIQQQCADLAAQVSRLAERVVLAERAAATATEKLAATEARLAAIEAVPTVATHLKGKKP